MSERRPSSQPPAPSSSSSLALQRAAEPWRDPEWERLWLALQARSWKSLALIPAAEGAPDDFTLLVAVVLSRTGMVHLGSPVSVGDATHVALSQLAAFLDQVGQHTADNERIIVALPPATKSPVTKSLAQALDASLLCVLMEKMSLFEARKTVEQIGSPRFIGSAMFHPSQLERPNARRK